MRLTPPQALALLAAGSFGVTLSALFLMGA